MIGVALVVFVAIFAAGIRATIDKGIDEQVCGRADRHARGRLLADARAASSTQVAQGRRRQRRLADPLRDRQAPRATTSNAGVTGVDPATVADVLSLKWKNGSAGRARAASPRRQAIVGQDWATATTSRSATASRCYDAARQDRSTYKIAGTYDTQAGMIGDVIVSNESLEHDWDSKDVAFVLVGARPGTDAEQLKRGRGAGAEAVPDRQAADDRGLQGRAGQAASTSCSGSSTRCWRCR